MTAISVRLVQINEFWEKDYVNIACSGYDGDPCDYSPIRQAEWAVVDEEDYAYDYVCRWCAADIDKTSAATWGTPRQLGDDGKPLP